MRLFRRRRGRHALGAAVTAIPSAPLAVPPPLPAQEAEGPPAPSVVMTPVAPEVASEIAQLIASGEAWRSTTGGTAAVCSARHGDAGPGGAPSVTARVANAVSPQRVTTEPDAVLPRQPASSSARVTDPAQLDLRARGEDLVVHAVADEVPAPRRIQLGFRDGTSAVLDPSSSQARALEELARSLTTRH